MSTTRMLFIVGTLDVGGMERLVIDMVKELDPRQFEVTVCAIDRAGTLAPVLEDSPVDVVSLDKPAGLSFKTVIALKRLIRRRRIDLIHTHNSNAHFYGALANRLSLRRRPLIHTKHGRGSPDNSKEVLRDRVCAFLTDVVVGVSEDVRQLCITVERVPDSKVKTIVNGVRLQPYINAARDRKRGAKLTFGHVGRLDSVKNQAMILRVFRQFRESFPESRLILVGDGPLRTALEDESSALGIADGVQFLGHRTDIPDIVAGFDCFVMSSVSEGTPLAVIEAMAARCPIISTDVGGMSEIVEEGKTGYLVPSGDERQMLERWLRLARDPGRHEEFGVAGQELAMSQYGIDRMLQEYLGLYDQLLER